MNIAVMSDIHANPLALEKVIKDIEKFKADKIFCLGDLVLGGYNPNKTMKMIFDLQEKYQENFVIIQGNTDKMIAQATPSLIAKTKKIFPCMGYSLEDDIKITHKKYIDYLGKLQETKQLNIHGVKIELCHGSPRSQDENIFPRLTEIIVEKMVEGCDSDLILCGHTHEPCGYSLPSGQMVANVGSVGRSLTKDRMPVYLQLTIDVCGGFLCKHKTVRYDNLQAQKHILARGLNKCEDLAKMYV